MVQSLASAAMAPMAANAGATATPRTPNVSGNSAMILPFCLTETLRTLPSWSRFLRVSRICVPVACRVSTVGRSCTCMGIGRARPAHGCTGHRECTRCIESCRDRTMTQRPNLADYARTELRAEAVYRGYRPKAGVLNDVARALPQAHLVIVSGAWCGDCRMR